MSHQRVPRSPSPIVTAVATAEFINDDRVSGVSTPRSRRHFLPRHSSRLVGINSLPDHDDFLPPTPSDSDSEDSPLVGRSRPIPRPQPSSTPITGVGELTLVRSNDSTNEAPMRVTMDQHLRTSPGDQAIAVSNMAFPSDLPPPLSNSGSDTIPASIHGLRVTSNQLWTRQGPAFHTNPALMSLPLHLPPDPLRLPRVPHLRPQIHLVANISSPVGHPLSDRDPAIRNPETCLTRIPWTRLKRIQP